MLRLFLVAPTMFQDNSPDVEKASDQPTPVEKVEVEDSVLKAIPISNSETRKFPETWQSILWMAVSIVSCGLYGMALSSMLGARYLYFLPGVLVCLPLVIFVPIFGLLFKTEMGIFILFTNIMMTWAYIPIIFMNSYVVALCSAWIVAYFNAGLLEEIFKALIYLIPLWMGRIRYGYQVIYYAAIAGLMFGVGENVLYAVQFMMLQDSNRKDPAFAAANIADILIQYRVFTTVLLHIFLTVLGACFVAYYLTGLWSRRIPRWFICCIAILVPAILHGTYDAFLMNFNGEYSLVSKCIVGLLIVSVFGLLLKLRYQKLSQKVSN